MISFCFPHAEYIRRSLFFPLGQDFPVTKDFCVVKQKHLAVTCCEFDLHNQQYIDGGGGHCMNIFANTPTSLGALTCLVSWNSFVPPWEVVG